MSEQLRISVRFLDSAFHGRCDGGEAEWPPSPLRLFQAIVAAAARRWSDIAQKKNDASVLHWLEQLPPPEIFAARAATIQPEGYKLYVPDNVGDVVARSWAQGRENDIANFRTDKLVRPTLLDAEGDSSDLSIRAFPTVHYLWSLNEAAKPLPNELRDTIIALARAISRLGWGIDLVVTDAVIEENEDPIKPLTGERWLPVKTPGGASLRVPVNGTLDALDERHAAFLSRIRLLGDGSQIFVPVPPLAPTAFRVITYRRETDRARPPYAVFALREPDDSRFACFDPKWRRLHLTGMLRHAASRPDFAAALGWNEDKINAFVLGHDKSDPNNTKPTADTPRLMFIPLPSIEWRGEERGHTVGLIRRVLVTVQGSCDPAEFQRIIRTLEGREIIDEKKKTPIAFLRRQAESDAAISAYFKESAIWTTVTPVVLPGYDDPQQLRRRLRAGAPPISAAEKEQIVRKLDARIERLLRKALLTSGLPPQLVADADLQWRSSGFFPGADLSSRYSVPDQCRRFQRVHVRIAWRKRMPCGALQPLKLSGPSCVGSGRFSGLGLFVSAGDPPQEKTP